MWTLVACGEGGGEEAIGIVADVKRESKGTIDTHSIAFWHNFSVGEGEYIIPTSTIFGMDMAEVKQLIGEGLKVLLLQIYAYRYI